MLLIYLKFFNYRKLYSSIFINQMPKSLTSIIILKKTLCLKAIWNTFFFVCHRNNQFSAVLFFIMKSYQGLSTWQLSVLNQPVISSFCHLLIVSLWCLPEGSPISYRPEFVFKGQSQSPGKRTIPGIWNPLILRRMDTWVQASEETWLR